MLTSSVAVNVPPSSYIFDYSIGNVAIELVGQSAFIVGELRIKCVKPLLVDFGEAGYAGEGVIKADDTCSDTHKFSFNIAYTPETNADEIESLLDIEVDVMD